MVAWDRVTRRDVLRAIQEYDRLGPEQFFSEHGEQLGSGDFEGGKAGAVRVLGKLGFSIEKKLKK
jgi:hypothetical protein